MKEHAQGCTIFYGLHNGNPADGICTCGFGFLGVKFGPGVEGSMYSRERLNKMANDARTAELQKAKDLLVECIKGLDLLGCDRVGAKGWPAYEARKRAQDFLNGGGPLMYPENIY